MASLLASCALKPGVLASRLPDGSTVLLDPDTEMYYGLDAVGAVIWAGLADGETPDSIVGQLLESIDADEHEIRRGVTSLLAELLDEGLIIAEGVNQNGN